ncbi:signal transduction histidine kinase [Cohnella lupini]|uniref:histidine kinase n=1 Tax=Cohnella lupini TaxID=1294267 RepID=A0A3D9I3P1_9BACL|nr:signal transduction histidine kinase [Cohnella lupini]
MANYSKLEKLNNPSSYLLLSILRLSFFIILSCMYLFINDNTVGWVKAFVIVSMLILFINHFLYYFASRTAQVLTLAVVDTAITAPYGYVYLGGDYPDLLFLGLVGLFLFMYIEIRAVTIVWFIFVPLNIGIQIILEQHEFGKFQIVMYFVSGTFVVFASLVGSLIRYYRHARSQTALLNAELKKSNQQLIEYSHKVESLSASRERIRIAREIHDTVGHKLTALLMQLQVARKLQESHSDQSKMSFMHCEELARSALQEIRLSVRDMREDDNQRTIKEMLDRLAGQFAEMTDMRITVQVDQEFPVIPDALRLNLSRIVQESLTNAKKHGDATEAWVTLQCSEQQIELRIKDNGTGKAEFAPEFGLLNMKERVQEHGGTLQIDSFQEKGFKIHVLIPFKRKPQ